jgi:hypothetical protein
MSRLSGQGWAVNARRSGQLIGYARTSTAEQEAGLEAQVRDLEGGVDIGNDVFGRRDSNDFASGDKDPLAFVGEAYRPPVQAHPSCFRHLPTGDASSVQKLNAIPPPASQGFNGNLYGVSDFFVRGTANSHEPDDWYEVGAISARSAGSAAVAEGVSVPLWRSRTTSWTYIIPLHAPASETPPLACRK